MGEAAGRKYLEDVLAVKPTPEVVSAMLSCSRCSLPWASFSRLQGRAAHTHLAVSALRAELLWAHFFWAVSLWLGPQRSPLLLAALCSAVDLIRSGGKKLRFLVAKSDMEIAKKIVSSSSSS